MESHALDALEAELGIKLPSDYKVTMAHYPFSGDHAGMEMLVDNPNLLREWNAPAVVQKRARKKKPDPTADCFMIGSDGSEIQFYLTHGDRCSIYYYDVESGEFALYAQSMEEYLQRCENIESGAELYPNESADIAEWIKWVYTAAIFSGFVLFGWGVFRGAEWLMRQIIGSG